MYQSLITATGISQVFDYDRKSVAFFRLFLQQNNLYGKFLVRFCKGSIYSSSGFLRKFKKVLMRKDCVSILRHFESCHVASKSSSFPGLLSHKLLCFGVMKIDRVRLCCSA